MPMVQGDCGESIFVGLVSADPTPDWCDANAPAQAVALFGAPGQKQASWAFRNLLGFYENPPAVTTIPDWFCWVWGKTPTKWGIFLLNLFYIPFAFMDGLYGWLSPTSCNRGGLAIIRFRRAIQSFITKWTGITWYESEANQIATINYLCPNVYPTVGLVASAWSSGFLSKADAEGWFKANGLCPITVDLSFKTSRYYHSPHTIIDLHRRHCISVRADAEARLEESGVTDARERTELLDCTYRQWDLGMIWRALNTMRPGRVPRALEYVEANAREDIIALGYDPARVDRMIWLARKDISHRFLLPPYRKGQISTALIVEYLKDDGWLQRDIDQILPFYQLERAQDHAAAIGIPSPNEVANGLADGTITDAEAVTYTKARGRTDFDAQDLIRQSHERRVTDRKKAGIAAVRSGLKAGELEQQSAAVALQRYGIDAGTATEIILVWLAEAEVARKPAGVAQMCEWTTKGWMPVSEFRYRLRRMGYFPLDVERIIRACGFKQLEKQQKIDAANDRRRVADEGKAERNRQALRKANEAKAAKAGKAATTANQKQLTEMKGDLNRGLAEIASQLAHVEKRAKTKGATIDPADVAADPPPHGPPDLGP